MARDAACGVWRPQGAYRVNVPEGVEPAAFGGGAPFCSVPTSPFGPEIPGGVDVAGDGVPGVAPTPAPGGMGSTPGMALPVFPPAPFGAACAAAAHKHDSKNKIAAVLNILLHEFSTIGIQSAASPTWNSGRALSAPINASNHERKVLGAHAREVVIRARASLRIAVGLTPARAARDKEPA